MRNGLVYYVRPECGVEDRWGPTLGPFPHYVQLTYSELTVGPDGEFLAGLADGEWNFSRGPIRAGEAGPEWPADFSDSFGMKVPAKWHELWWSDVVIWAQPEKKEGQG